MGNTLCPAVSQTTTDHRANLDEMRIRRDQTPGADPYEYDSPRQRKKQRPMNPAAKEDFHFIKVIGQGSYGKVFLVKHKLTERLLAMKVIKKELIFRTC